MLSLNIIFQILTIHWIADFIWQSDWMAINKSTKVSALLAHVGFYSVGLFIMFGWEFALINGVAHFVIDFFSSKATSYLWKKEERHWFFVTIGFDQALHYTVLFCTALYLNLH